jgi:hypothetical protein
VIRRSRRGQRRDRRSRWLPATVAKGGWRLGRDGGVESAERSAVDRGILRPACLSQHSEGPGDSGGEVCKVEELGAFGNRSLEYCLADGEIQSRSKTTSWSARSHENMSERLAQLRWRRTCSRTIERRSRLTKVSRRPLAEWRRGDLWFRAAWRRWARVLGGESVRGGRGL